MNYYVALKNMYFLNNVCVLNEELESKKKKKSYLTKIEKLS